MNNRALCATCGGNGVLKIFRGVSVCEACRGEGWWAPGSALGSLVDAVDAYLAAKGGPDAAWVTSFNGLMVALRDAKAALGKAS